MHSLSGRSRFIWTRLYIKETSIFAESQWNLVNPILLALPFASERMEQFTPSDNKSQLTRPVVYAGGCFTEMVST